MSVTTSRTTERDWIGRTTNETKNVTVEIIADVPQQFPNAADAISSAVPKLSVSAQAFGAVIEGRGAPLLSAQEETHNAKRPQAIQETQNQAS